MIKTAELTGPSCLTRAADDEPLFVLRANDPLAPKVVREWAYRYEEEKADAGGMLTEKQLAKTEEARDLADAMEVWKRAHP